MPDFSSLHLRPELEQTLAELGYAEPTPIQERVIPLMLAGADVIGQAQTGTGKTAAFALPILHQHIHQRLPQALILAPTRELALQVSSAVERYGKRLNVRALAVYGGQSYSVQINALKRGVDIIVGAPGRVMDLMERKVLDLSAVRCVVLDEADEMLNMGFIEAVERILAATPVARQTALFSATMPPRIRALANQFLRDPQVVAVKKETLTVAAIEQRYYVVREEDKLSALTSLFEVEPMTSALIFARTRIETGQLASQLSTRGFPAEALNGDLEQSAREQILSRFRAGQIKVLVATDVAARGLDIDDVSHVFNYHLPDDAEVYVHRVGRTGRAGKTGVAISFFTPREKRRLLEIERLTRQPIIAGKLPTAQEIQAMRENQILEQMRVWLKRGRYQRERELAARLLEEGFDPLEIAAAALKVSRAAEKQRPVVNVAAAEFPESARKQAKGARRESLGRAELKRGAEGGRKSHEAGMIRLKINKGKRDGIRPNDIVATIARYADLPGGVIGKILIEEKFSYVDLPEELAERALKQNGNYKIGKARFVLTKA